MVIRFSSIGDIVLTSPVIRCLKQQTKAEIHFLTKENFKDVLAGNPYIDKLHFLQDSLEDTLLNLKKEGFSYIVDLHHNLRTTRIKRTLNLPSEKFYKANFSKWLMVNLKIDRLPKIHIVQRYLETVKGLGVIDDRKGLDFFLEESKTEAILKWVTDYQKQNLKFLTFAIGAQHATKRLPKHKILDICRKAEQPVLLLGGKGEAEIGAFIEAELGEKVENFCGKISLQESALLIEKSSLLITHDTGMMHIGAALKKPIVSIWGNTIPGFGMYPYLPERENQHRMIEVANLSCRPCSKIGYSACPKDHFKCMEDQQVGEVINNIQQLLF